MLDVLRTMPPLHIYCGFVIYSHETGSQNWIRTFGNHSLGFPDLAFLAGQDRSSRWVFDLFNNVLAYVKDTGALILPGHTGEFADGVCVRFRLRNDAETFLESEGRMLILEQITKQETNKRIAGEEHDDPIG